MRTIINAIGIVVWFVLSAISLFVETMTMGILYHTTQFRDKGFKARVSVFLRAQNEYSNVQRALAKIHGRDSLEHVCAKAATTEHYRAFIYANFPIFYVVHLIVVATLEFQRKIFLLEPACPINQKKLMAKEKALK